MNFRFQNLLGAPYRGGNVVVSDDSLLSPVGNRVSVTDLVKSHSLTLPFEATSNISRIAVSPDGNFLLAVDDSSRALYVNLRRRAVLHHITFKKRVTALRFSSDGSLIGVGLGKLLQIWRSPGFRKEFFPFKLLRTFADCASAITSLDWSPDSSYILVGSKDLAVRLFFVKKTKVRTRPYLFLGHREAIVGVFFSIEKKTSGVCRIYTISRDGAIFTWKLDESSNSSDNSGGNIFDPPERKKSEGESEEDDKVIHDRSDEVIEDRKRKRESSDGVDIDTPGIPLHEMKWELSKKDFFMQAPARLTTCDYHRELDMVVVGFSNGVFGLYQMPDFVCIHLLSISREKITTAVFNRLGNWLTFGCAKLGQLLVWEWRSESYILKQQGHYFDVNCVAYSPDSQMLATGADDNKVKVSGRR